MVLLLAAGGCNNGKQLQADLYQRELRLQEDEIYRLEDYIEEYQGIIRGYRCEVAELKRQLADGEGAEPTPAGPEFRPGAAPRRDEAERDASDLLPAPDAGEAPAFTPEMPEEEAPPFETSAETETAHDAHLASLEQEAAPTPTLLKLGEVDSLRLGVRNGEPADGGEPTLLAAVTPLSEGLPAYFEGEASVLLAEIPRDGPMRRVARWDFTADEVEASWVEIDGATRLEFPLLAPAEAVAGTSTDRPMRVWVRLVDSRGRKTLRSIEARFTHEPFGVVDETPPEPPTAPIALQPRRLPPPGSVPLATVGESEGQPTNWRRKTPERIGGARRDAGVVPASFVAPVAQQEGRDAEWRGAAAP